MKTLFIRCPTGQQLVNTAHIIRLVVAQDRLPADDQRPAWGVNLRLADPSPAQAWLTWSRHRTRAEALAALHALGELLLAADTSR